LEVGLKAPVDDGRVLPGVQQPELGRFRRFVRPKP
jgi:hypothetical protein